MEIRRATSPDVPALAAMMSAAFSAYPWTQWVVDENDHETRLRGLYEIYLTVAVEHGEVWMTTDSSAAAAWTWSGDVDAVAEYMRSEGFDLRAAELSGDRVGLAAQADDMLGARRLAEPHWYLASVGVHPSRQNQGIGTLILRPTLDLLDQREQVASLETSSEANVRLYTRLGFRTRDQFAIPGGGPHVWLMSRAPQPNVGTEDATSGS